MKKRSVLKTFCNFFALLSLKTIRVVPHIYTHFLFFPSFKPLVGEKAPPPKKKGTLKQQRYLDFLLETHFHHTPQRDCNRNYVTSSNGLSSIQFARLRAGVHFLPYAYVLLQVFPCFWAIYAGRRPLAATHTKVFLSLPQGP